MLTICLIVIAVCAALWILVAYRKSKIEAPPPEAAEEIVPDEPEPTPPQPIEQRKIVLSGHSIDRATTRHYKVYLGYRDHKEDGLHSWLMREMKSLRSSGQLTDGENAIDHLGVLWAIIVRDDIVVLKSLSFKKGKHRRKKPLSNNQIAKLKRRKGNARMRGD